MARGVKCASSVQAFLVALVGAVRSPEGPDLMEPDPSNVKAILADVDKEICGVTNLRAALKIQAGAQAYRTIKIREVENIASQYIQQNKDTQETDQAKKLQECVDARNAIQAFKQELTKLADGVEDAHTTFKIQRERLNKLDISLKEAITKTANLDELVRKAKEPYEAAMKSLEAYQEAYQEGQTLNGNVNDAGSQTSLQQALSKLQDHIKATHKAFREQRRPAIEARSQMVDLETESENAKQALQKAKEQWDAAKGSITAYFKEATSS